MFRSRIRNEVSDWNNFQIHGYLNVFFSHLSFTASSITESFTNRYVPVRDSIDDRWLSRFMIKVGSSLQEARG